MEVNGTLLDHAESDHPPVNVNDLPAGWPLLNLMQSARFVGITPLALRGFAERGTIRWFRKGTGGKGKRVQRAFMRRDLVALKKRLAEEAAAKQAMKTKPEPEQAKSAAPVALSAIDALALGALDTLSARITELEAKIDRLLAACEA